MPPKLPWKPLAKKLSPNNFNLNIRIAIVAPKPVLLELREAQSFFVAEVFVKGYCFFCRYKATNKNKSNVKRDEIF